MRLQAVIVVVSILAVSLSGIAGQICLFMMVEKVNQILPGNREYSQMWWYPGKLFRLFGDYRRLYPKGQLAGYTVTMIVVMGAALITAFAALVAISPKTTAH